MSGQPTHPLRVFAIASLTPVVLIALAAIFGGCFAAVALIYMTLLVYGLDAVIARITPPLDEEDTAQGADRLSALLALSHFGLLGLVVFSLGGGMQHSLAATACTFLAAGLFFGQVSNANAHELIHRSDRALRSLGRWVYISLLFGHHASAHPKVHHRWVATPDDPNTAQEGESFYDFAPRAWIGSFVAGYEMEKQDLVRRQRWGMHPYYIYVAGAIVMMVAALWIGGIGGFLVYLLLCLHAQMQLLLSDYVQHYGLLRDKRPDGDFAPVGVEHSWNAPHWFSSHMMLNAPRHSDHHDHPMRRYPALSLPDAQTAPILPYSLPMMATIALIPPLWDRVMGRALRKWRSRSAPQAEMATTHS
ncbi:alkane 1-monooxygenase [Aliiroseovarius sp. S2029]|uniref:alkane 1-monooxygenase n=1 Tax=Aliiroseovarius sp. S2029 TaxID=2936988 RepID=UPI0020BF020B|nr:alkane 1-monooxygenase [Aliiroseovarius sp. S2029]MCK8483050.1 alkane 1-monooxygenase [Aliiroseovarius sp. S2029]